MRRPLTRTLAVTAAALLVLLWPVGPAMAHTSLLDGAPGPGDEVAVGTDVVVLEFEGVLPGGAHVIAVTADATDEPLPVGTAVAADATTVCARVEPLAAGVHAVEYDVVSDDGHAVQGRYLFEVVSGAAAPPVVAGCEAAALPAPELARSLGLEAADLPGWALPAIGAAGLVTAATAMIAVARRRDAEED